MSFAGKTSVENEAGKPLPILPSSAKVSPISCAQSPTKSASSESETSAPFPMSIANDASRFDAFTLGLAP
jgi:hypothetical protein